MADTPQDTSSLQELMGKAGNADLREANIGLAIAGPIIGGIEGYFSAIANNKYKEESFDDALEFRKKEFQHQITQFLANTARSRKTLSDNYHEVLKSIDQSRVSAQEEIWGIMHDLRKTHARALNSAADREVYGNTISILLDNIMANEYHKVENVTMEQKWGEEARMRNMSNLYSDAETQRLASIPRPAGPMDIPQVQPMPNPVNVVMQSAGAALKAYAQFPPGADETDNLRVDPTQPRELLGPNTPENPTERRKPVTGGP